MVLENHLSMILDKLVGAFGCFCAILSMRHQIQN